MATSPKLLRFGLGFCLSFCYIRGLTYMFSVVSGGELHQMRSQRQFICSSSTFHTPSTVYRKLGIPQLSKQSVATLLTAGPYGTIEHQSPDPTISVASSFSHADQVKRNMTPWWDLNSAISRAEHSEKPPVPDFTCFENFSQTNMA